VAQFLNEHKEHSSVDYDDLVIVTKIHPRSFAYEKMVEAVNQSKKLLYKNYHAASTSTTTSSAEVEDAGSDADKVQHQHQLLHPVDVVLLHSPYCWPGHCTPEEEKVPPPLLIIYYSLCSDLYSLQKAY
jgi:diketogulonate reductase-like aldo/keto reductase